MLVTSHSVTGIFLTFSTEGNLTGFHRQAKLFELNIFMGKLSSRLFILIDQAGKTILSASQFAQYSVFQISEGSQVKNPTRSATYMTQQININKICNDLVWTVGTDTSLLTPCIKTLSGTLSVWQWYLTIKVIRPSDLAPWQSLLLS